MAIKIKKKDGSGAQDEAPELVDETAGPAEAAGARAALSADADPLLKASWETATWVEENRMLVVGAVVLVFVAIIGGYVGLQVLESQQVTASNTMSPTFDAYTTLVDGSAEMEALKANPNIPAPETTFESNAERWQAVYDKAAATLAAHPKGDVAQAARLAQASAAVKIDKADEAVALYEKFLAQNTDEAMKVAALQGLATAYSRAEKWDEAVESLDQLAALGDDFGAGAKYQKARILQRAGKSEEAKALYHEILDEQPEHPSRADIERRLATM
mgnify:CR=1 FL=1